MNGSDKSAVITHPRFPAAGFFSTFASFAMSPAGHVAERPPIIGTARVIHNRTVASTSTLTAFEGRDNNYAVPARERS